MIQAPARQTTQPTTERRRRVRPQRTPRRRATTGVMKTVPAARAAPTRPAAVAIRTNATPVPSAPRRAATAPATATTARAARRERRAARSGSPTPSARQTTGSAPLRCWSGRAKLSANRTTQRGEDQHHAEQAVASLRSSSAARSARRRSSRRRGRGPRALRRPRATALATMAANSGVAPLSMPVSADETCCSANGNMLSGKATQTAERRGPRTSAAEIGLRARAQGERSESMTTRTNVTPFGATASRPSAMNRNEVPQIVPGPATIAQSQAVGV